MGALNNPTNIDLYILYIDVEYFEYWAISQVLPIEKIALLNEAEVKAADKALTSDNNAMRNSFFDMATHSRH